MVNLVNFVSRVHAYNKYIYNNNPLAELNQRMLNPSYRFSIY